MNESIEFDQQVEDQQVDDQRVDSQLLDMIGTPSASEVGACRDRCKKWFAATAPIVRWDTIQTPLGKLYIAASKQGVCNIELGIGENEFLTRIDPLARTEQDSETIAPYARQLDEYFDHERSGFEMRLDFTRLTPFQKTVLETIQSIPAGSVWTYTQVANAIGKPAAVRAVGQALHINPMLIVVPCHRVVGSDGTLRGYRAGLETKQRLLQFEGAL